jgi:hypothetical protein
VKIELLCAPGRDDLERVLLPALCRSYTSTQVDRVDGGRHVPRCLVVSEPADALYGEIARALERGGVKVLLLGALGMRIAERLGVVLSDAPVTALEAGARCEAALPGRLAESTLRIRYRGEHRGLTSPIVDRPFARYDFAAEWNNLGYGAVRADGSMWSIAQMVQAPAGAEVAAVWRGDERVCTYAALFDHPQASVLWINRAAGTIDSAEWRLVEMFFTHHRPGVLPCLPWPSEVPAGYDAAVTMRLDCDEDVRSAGKLAACYAQREVPLSLAVKTSLLDDAGHREFVTAVAAGGGSILSHSATHPSNWGAGYDGALAEARASRASLEEALGDGSPVDYAVSPFHQNPPYAVKALDAAGYKGFVAGIVANDPDYLLGRAGVVPDGGPALVSHSQQCMLHGDCLSIEGDPLRTYFESFDIARRARSLFGYLDHPFSVRYQYGWRTEDDRIAAHARYLEYIAASGKVLFMAEADALNFVHARAGSRFEWRAGEWRYACSDARWAVEYAGRTYSVANAGYA